MFRRNTNNRGPPREEPTGNDADGFKKGGPPTFSRGGNAPRRETGGAGGFNGGN